MKVVIKARGDRLLEIQLPPGEDAMRFTEFAFKDGSGRLVAWKTEESPVVIRAGETLSFEIQEEPK